MKTKHHEQESVRTALDQSDLSEFQLLGLLGTDYKISLLNMLKEIK